MIKIFTLIKISFLPVLLFCIEVNGQQPAFPSAEGFGANAKGGRGGKVIFVENLNDSGPGSLRSAIEDNSPRTVIFRISGTIELESRLIIEHPFLTIAGQTSPGEGICLKNFPLQIEGTHDVIVRSIRIRPGINSGLEGSSIDAIQLRESSNIIIDHCSASWGTDELLNTWHGNKDITIQWCIFSEPLTNSVHLKGAHGYAASIGGIRTSYHHNLLANAAGRNPSIGGNANDTTRLLDFRNNVVFNWQHRTCDGKPHTINFAGNYYKPGPATQDEVKERLVKIDNSNKYGYTSIWYIHNNIMEGSPRLSDNNWEGGVEFEEGSSMEKNRSATPFENANYKMEQPEEAYRKVLESAGAIAPERDEVDRRIISEVKSGKVTHGDGIIDSVEEVGGWPGLESVSPPADKDRDGIPDEWELKKGLDPANSSDGNTDNDGDGYTNLENYLNSLIE